MIGLILGIAGSFIGAALLLIPMTRAGRNRKRAWSNPIWMEDIQDLRFVCGVGILALMFSGGLLTLRLFGQ